MITITTYDAYANSGQSLEPHARTTGLTVPNALDFLLRHFSTRAPKELGFTLDMDLNLIKGSTSLPHLLVIDHLRLIFDAETRTLLEETHLKRFHYFSAQGALKGIYRRGQTYLDFKNDQPVRVWNIYRLGYASKGA